MSDPHQHNFSHATKLQEEKEQGEQFDETTIRSANGKKREPLDFIPSTSSVPVFQSPPS